jgi:hypothetical protein
VALTVRGQPHGLTERERQTRPGGAGRRRSVWPPTPSVGVIVEPLVLVRRTEAAMAVGCRSREMR